MDMLEKLAPQVPTLVVLAIVVVYIVSMFLKASDTQRKDAQDTLRTQIDTFLTYMAEQRAMFLKEVREIHDQHIEARKLTREALEKQMELARDTARGNMEVARAITALSDRVSNHHK